MKKSTFTFLSFLAFIASGHAVNAQQIRVGVFDINLMVQAMPAYRQVDSLVQLYERDSLAPEYEIYQSEYARLDSTFKNDSVLAAAGKKSQKVLDYTSGQRQKMALNIVYWQQLAQNKSNYKRNQLASPLYDQVAMAYKRVLDKKKYSIVLKPQTYEFGFRIENIFVSVARELKLSGLPEELLTLGVDPDAQTISSAVPKNTARPQ